MKGMPLVDGADYEASAHPPCLVIGLDHNGLGIVRALGRRGVQVVAVDLYAIAAHKATNHATYVQCKDVADVGLIDTLCHVVARFRQPAVLIQTLDRSVTLVSEHRARREPCYRHSLPSDEVVQRLMSKGGIAEYAAERGFRAPRTFVIGSEGCPPRCRRRPGRHRPRRARGTVEPGGPLRGVTDAREVAARRPQLVNVRGRGLMVGFDVP